MTPDQLAKTGSEHAEQRALFAWANMAARYGFGVAWDDHSYTVPKHAVERSCDPLTREKPVPELYRLFAIPNGGKRDKITAAKLKAEGVKPGVPDIFLPVPCFHFRVENDPRGPENEYHGLFIELKRAASVGRAKGSTQDNQDDWIGFLREQGYAVSVCFGWRAAAIDIQKYMIGG